MNTREYVMHEDRRSPLVIEPRTSHADLAKLVADPAADIEGRLTKYGALLFRGFAVDGIAAFDAFVGSASREKLDYVYGSTPRTAIGDRIFTATEYPANQEIPMHNENAYQRVWPKKIALCCLVPAATGGETPIADMRAVTAAIGSRLIDKFEAKRVKYVRHYRPFTDVPWQQVFQTEDRGELARFCLANGIAHEWLDAETLRTSQVCQGVAYHPVLGDRVFFNQAHLFHLSSLAPEVARSMVEIFGSDQLPRQTYYGNGEEIPAEDLEAVRKAFREHSLAFPWQAGDVLLLDNMQFAHGRRPFTGQRKVIAALMESRSEQDVAPLAAVAG
jgi:alpha-ketoglutarate-dependent taurine dioxygenase